MPPAASPGAVGVDRGVIVAGFSQVPVNKMTIFRRGSGRQWQPEQTIDASGPLAMDRGAFVAAKELWARTGMGAAPWQKVSFLHSQWANVDICNGVMTGGDRIPMTGVSSTDAGFIAEAGVRCGIVDDDSHIVSVNQLVNAGENPNTIAEARMRLSVTWPIHIPTHIPWHTVDDTAVAGIDYIGASGVATIFPGRNSTDISLGILPDADTNLNERFQVVLEKPNFGRVTEAAQYVNIGNWTADWDVPDRSFTFPEPESGEQTFVIPVSLPHALTTPTTFNYAASAGTATTSDFIAGEFSLTLPAGSSVLPLSIVIRADGVTEPVETFSITFYSLGLTTFTVRIDDSTVPGLNRHSYSASQGTTLVQNAPGVLAGNTGGYLRSRIVQPAAHGTVELQSDGAFTYTPAPNFAGVDQFSFQAISSADVLIAAPDTGTWRWLHPLNGIDPADGIPGFHSNWMNSGFDDTGWNTGTGLMAYGAIGPGAGEPIDTNIGNPLSGQRFSAYFRRTFLAPALPGPLTVEFVCDDAAIFYVNGIEAARFADPPIGDFGPAPDSYKLLCSSSLGDSSEPLVQTLVLPAGTTEGGNLLAVSLHNRSETSSDLGFRLHSLYPGTWSQPVWVTIVVNESAQPPRLSPDTYNFPAFSPAVDSLLGKTTSLFDNDGLLNDSGVMIDPILEVATGGSPAGPVQVDPANGHFRMEVPPGFFGQTDFTYRVRDKDGWSDSASVIVNVAPPTALDEWRLTNYGASSLNTESDPFADPDADGLVNVFEFLIGSPADQPNTSPVPAVSAISGDIVLDFSIPDYRSRAGLTLAIECADSLSDAAAWRPLMVLTDYNSTQNLPPGMTWTRTPSPGREAYRINTGTPLEEKRFYRLRAMSFRHGGGSNERSGNPRLTSRGRSSRHRRVSPG